MSDEPRRSKLGRGLSALFAEEAETASDQTTQPRTLAIDRLRPGRYQPRRHFDEDALEALVNSVREKGILQPLLVRPHDEHPAHYEIVAGERRWRAAQLAQLHEVPVVIRELSHREALEIALVENIQREDLGPLEEADGYRRLMDEFSHTQEDLAKAVGKSRSHVANMMRLLGLPEPVKLLVNDGKLTAGHARALLTASDPAGLAAVIVAQGLNVRQAEALAAGRDKAPASRGSAPVAKDPDTVALERELGQLLGLKVLIASDGAGGALTIQYRSLEQLDDVLRRLNQEPVGRGARAR